MYMVFVLIFHADVPWLFSEAVRALVLHEAPPEGSGSARKAEPSSN